MKVKNNHTTHIGFGEMRLLPGESIDVSKLPRGYGLDNPAVKFYISKKWLVVIGGNNDKGNAVQPVNVSANLPGGNSGANEKTHLDPEQFDGWETEQIFRLAADMSIELGDAPERDDIIAKIAAVEVEVGEYSDLNPEDYNPEDNGTGDNSNLASKALETLTPDELKALAAEMKIKVVKADTPETIIKKINAARNGE